jgi:hypothetical protein
LTRFYKKPEVISDIQNDKASIIFNLDAIGNIDIQFLWPETSVLNKLEIQKLAKNYSALISIINLGGFKGDILKILLQSQKDTTYSSDKIFIADVLSYMVETENSMKINHPLVSPSKVFKKYE